MYRFFKGKPSRAANAYVFPELIYLRRVFQRMLTDVKEYYHKYPKYVDPTNPIGNILLHIPLRNDLDDLDYVRFVEDIMDPLVKTFGFVSSISRGRVYANGVTIGKGNPEVIYAHSERFDINDIRLRWRELAPFTYLYHSRTDINLPIMNNTMKGQAYAVGSLNIPMLAVKYRYWRRRQVEGDVLNREAVNRFIGGFVLPNAIDSFLDIAFFNRLMYAYEGKEVPQHVTQHPFYITDLSDRVTRLIGLVNQSTIHRAKDIEQLAWSLPAMVNENLSYVMRLPGSVVTRQNEWVVILSRLPYVNYLCKQVIASDRTDRDHLGKVKIAIIEARWDNTVKTVGSSVLAETYSKLTNETLELIK